MLRLLVLGSLLLVVSLAACAPDPAAPPAPTEVPETPESLATDDSLATLEASEAAVTEGSDATEWTIGETHVDRAQQRGAMLRSLRSAAHEDSDDALGYDRVVFEFDGAVPGYRIAYVDRPAYHCASAEAFYIDGDGWLEVAFYPAAAHTEAGQPTIREQRIAYTLPNLREAVSTCDFEGYVTWVLGLASPNPYRVLELTDPARLVVDVRHED